MVEVNEIALIAIQLEVNTVTHCIKINYKRLVISCVVYLDRGLGHSVHDRSAALE
jgi:hypothetical protein